MNHALLPRMMSVILILIGFLASGPAFADDHGNTTATATLIAANSTTAGSIETAGDNDYFRIDVPAGGGTLTVYTTGSTDTYGYLLNSAGTTLAYNDDYGSLNFRISQTVVAGTYYVRVRHYSGTGTGAYTLVSQFAPPVADDHGNTTATATLVAPNSSTAGTIGTAGDNDYFRIDIPAGGGSLTVSTSGSTDTYGYLLDSAGNTLAYNDQGVGNNFLITRAVTAGTYYVRVRHYSSTGTGAYSLVSQFAPAVVDDHGNTTAAATSINPSSSTAGNIETAGDNDYFRIVIPAGGGSLTVSTTGNTDTYGYLLDSAGNTLAYNDQGVGNNFLITQAVAAGTYYVRVRHYSGSGTGAYTLVSQFTAAPTDDHGNTTAAATLINPTSSTAGNIETAGDNDYFRIDVPAAGILTVNTTGSTDTYGYLLNSGGSTFASNNNATPDINFGITQPVSAGTYYVRVRHANASATGAYTVVANLRLGDEHGDSLATASWVGSSSTTFGRIEVAGDVDLFRVTAPAGGSLTLYTVGSTDTFGELLDSNGGVLSSNDNGSDTNFRITANPGAATTYYVRVRHADANSTGDYHFVSEYRTAPAGSLIVTAAGMGFKGFSGDSGLAAAAQLFGANDVAIAADGSQYIADHYNHRVRKVSPDGMISTVAGNGTAGFSGDGGPGVSAKLNWPKRVAVAADSSLYIADTSNNRVRRVGLDGNISTVAGGGASGDGGLATAAYISRPEGLAVASDGSLYIAENGGNRIRRVGPDGIIATVAGNGTAGFGGDGGAATSANLSAPSSVALAADGSVYIADTNNNRIRRVGVDGIISTVAGDGSPGNWGNGGLATAAAIAYPAGLALGGDGSLYLSSGNQVWRIGLDGYINAVAGSGLVASTLEPGDSGSGALGNVLEVGDGGAALAGSLSLPSGLTVAADGSLYVAEPGHNRIRRVVLP